MDTSIYRRQYEVDKTGNEEIEWLPNSNNFESEIKIRKRYNYSEYKFCGICGTQFFRAINISLEKFEKKQYCSPTCYYKSLRKKPLTEEDRLPPQKGRNPLSRHGNNKYSGEYNKKNKTTARIKSKYSQGV